MDHTLSHLERQPVRYVREWRSVDVHQPSASSLRTLGGALLLMSLALGVLALIVIAALPFLVLGALAWSARPWPRRGSSSGGGGWGLTDVRLPGQAFGPPRMRLVPPVAP